NVGALVASALQISDNDFSTGNYRFAASGGTGSVTARGAINVANGEFVVLAGNGGVTFSGSLKASGGTAVLAGVNKLTLAMNATGSGLTNYTLDGLAGTTAVGGSLNVASTSGGNGGLVETAGNSVVLGSDLTLNTGITGTWSYSQNGNIEIGWGETSTAQAI